MGSTESGRRRLVVVMVVEVMVMVAPPCESVEGSGIEAQIPVPAIVPIMPVATIVPSMHLLHQTAIERRGAVQTTGCSA